MAAIPDNDLFAHAYRTKGKSVIVTGGGSGIGKEVALKLAAHGAKVVIADVNMKAGEEVTTQINKAGGTAIATKCDVSNWDSLVDTFEHTLKVFHSVDVVVANAGITEVGVFYETQLDKEGRPQQMNTKTLDVNLIGTTYTVNLAQHYLSQGHDSSSSELKALVVLGSMASWQGVYVAPLYAASKHAILGLVRSLTPGFDLLGIRIACVHPFFADTSLVDFPMKVFLSGVPLTPISRIAGAIIYSATSPNKQDHGCVWLLTDDGPVFRLPQEELKGGVYDVINQRAVRVIRAIKSYQVYARVAKLFHLDKVLFVTAAVGIAWWRKDWIRFRFS
ncbi:hypothetical protein DL96DRAFT_1587348 [Flagelloscypha sp. PMI_526]|nr:hypothetical protein DL96DRAFT_1587348 [Flagelloscypha sp. PMI_526]